jgi:hypothetical protein
MTGLDSLALSRLDSRVTVPGYDRSRSYFLGGHTNLDPVDKRLTELREAVYAERDTPRAFLAYRPVFGDLGSSPTLKSAFIEARAALSRLGARAITALTERSSP